MSLVHRVYFVDLKRIHYSLVRFFADSDDPIVPAGARNTDLVESACARPFISLAGREKYPTILGKAAALFHSLVKNHAFHNGNKRTALLGLAIFLDRNGFRLRSSDDETFDFVLCVANNHVPGFDQAQNTDELVDQIRCWLDDNTEAYSQIPRSMLTREFLKACKQAGARVTISKSGGSFIVLGNDHKIITISRSTRRLAGPVLKSYLSRLGLRTHITGIRLEELQDGLDPEQKLIQQLLNVLRKLAYV